MKDESTISRRVALKTMFAAGTSSVLDVKRAFSQTWPSKPIKAISPITAGSAADVIARSVFEQMSPLLGQPIIMENRPGAEGTIGCAAVARAEPDGYTLLSHSAALTVVAATYKDLPYDTVGDFSRITPMAKIPSVLVTSPSKNIHSIGEFISVARGKPINYASPGAFTRLNTERFLRSVGIEAQRIPFKGGEALTEVIAGRIDFYIAPLFLALSGINAGQLVAIAVSGSRRAPLLPDVPTFAEAGFSQADDNFWIGLFAPAKTPTSALDRLHDAAVKAVQTPTIDKKLAMFGAEPLTMSRDQFDGLVMSQIAENIRLAKAAGITED